MNVFLIFQFVIVTKFVMTTSSAGIIMSDRKRVKTRSLPLKSSLAKAKAASTVTTTMIPVVARVNMSVFRKYFASGTAVKASM